MTRLVHTIISILDAITGDAERVGVDGSRRIYASKKKYECN